MSKIVKGETFWWILLKNWDVPIWKCKMKNSLGKFLYWNQTYVLKWAAKGSNISVPKVMRLMWVKKICEVKRWVLLKFILTINFSSTDFLQTEEIRSRYSSWIHPCKQSKRNASKIFPQYFVILWIHVTKV